MKETGSEFWDVPVTDKQNGIFTESTQWFLSGRGALQSIIRELPDCHTAALPSWCCDSMILPFIKAGKEIRFYPVHWQGQLKQELSFDCDILFVMDYFGYTSGTQDLSGYQGTVIRDVTHSIFSKTYQDADYSFGSLRKWCGVWTGGYGWTKDGHKLTVENDTDQATRYIALRKKAMIDKENYLRGAGNKSYLDEFNQAEEMLDSMGSFTASARDVQMAARLDSHFIKQQRRKNAEILREAFREWLIFPEMEENDCPLFVPVLIPVGKRDMLKKALIGNRIYCPVHWPKSRYHQPDRESETIYRNELSLVCDQRYTETDMHQMIETIHQYMETN